MFPFVVCIMRRGEICGVPVMTKTFPTYQEASDFARRSIEHATDTPLVFIGQLHAMNRKEAGRGA